MWPFSNSNERCGNWLSAAQARQAVKIYYADLDEGCWFAAVFISDDDIIRFPASSKEEAIETAQALAAEVFAKTGRSLPIKEGR
jgi:hypothetical protein